MGQLCIFSQDRILLLASVVSVGSYQDRRIFESAFLSSYGRAETSPSIRRGSQLQIIYP